MLLTNWGNYPKVETTLLKPHDAANAEERIAHASQCIGRGLGRCYGDSACNASLVLSTLRLDKMLSFDAEAGVLVTEAGVSLSDIIDAFLPKGWFLPVTPGTKFVTIGGAVASDVHGKNHHIAGTMGQHVAWMDVLTAEKGLVRCSPSEHADLFHATCGGHGLTGLVVRVALRLIRVPSAWIDQTCIKTANLQEIMEAFEVHVAEPYSVAWIDCLQTGKAMGRSILMCGNFAQPEALDATRRGHPYASARKKQFTVPFNFPAIALNPLSVKLFNALYYGKAPNGATQGIVSCNSFFYPLDALNSWNRIYGKRGFTQYQFVLPKEAGPEGLPKILHQIAKSGSGSFLAVLKLFGGQPVIPGNISFPTEGYTLALDFPISAKLFPLLDQLDAMVLDYGGRHYLTKDARLAATTFRKGYGKLLEDFLTVKALWDPQNKFTSTQAQRLKLV